VLDAKHVAKSKIGRQVEIIKLMVEHGADANAVTNLGWAPCHYAVMRHRHAALRFLMSHGADLTPLVSTKLSALHIFCRETEERYVKGALSKPGLL
jgi:ankyrin repeat protein